MHTITNLTGHRKMGFSTHFKSNTSEASFLQFIWYDDIIDHSSLAHDIILLQDSKEPNK